MLTVIINRTTAKNSFLNDFCIKVLVSWIVVLLFSGLVVLLFGKHQYKVKQPNNKITKQLNNKSLLGLLHYSNPAEYVIDISHHHEQKKEAHADIL